MAAKTTEKAAIAIIEGYEVHLNYQHRFICYGKDIPVAEAMIAETFQDIKQKINDHVLKLSASERKQHKLSLPVITDMGMKAIVTGIHPRHRSLNGIKDMVKENVFPDVPWIVDLIKERARLSELINDINRKLRPFAIAKSVSGWGEMGAAVYESSTNELKKEYADALIAAQKVEQEMAGAKT